MDFVIKNQKSVYIRLNVDGQPVTCAKQDATRFGYSKAKNVFNNLPKPLKRLKFKIDSVPDVIFKDEDPKLQQLEKENN